MMWHDEKLIQFVTQSNQIVGAVLKHGKSLQDAMSELSIRLGQKVQLVMVSSDNKIGIPQTMLQLGDGLPPIPIQGFHGDQGSSRTPAMVTILPYAMQSLMDMGYNSPLVQVWINLLRQQAMEKNQ